MAAPLEEVAAAVRHRVAVRREPPRAASPLRAASQVRSSASCRWRSSSCSPPPRIVSWRRCTGLRRARPWSLEASCSKPSRTSGFHRHLLRVEA